jgi:hypothetical protein
MRHCDISITKICQFIEMTGCSAEDGFIFKSIPKDPYKGAVWVKRMNLVPPVFADNILFLIVK